jgi:hypothetical protein
LHDRTYTVQVKRLFLLLFLSANAGIWAADQSSPATLRWAEGAPNCTIQAADDGHTNYGLSSSDFEITLSVDRQELEKSPHRVIPMLGVLLTFRYKGTAQFEVQQNRFTLEFLKHFQVVQSSLDPDDILHRLQQNVDDLTDEVTRHQIRKHPDQKQQKEAELQTRLKDYTEMMDFISTRALRPTVLDPSNPSLSGWVFFSTRNKWIGGWRRPEQFVLRLPIQNLTVEFPFELPPKQRNIQLRRREP